MNCGSELYGSWTLKQIRDELRKRNAKISGRKNELVERLEAYDKNSNFNSRHQDLEPEYSMLVPDGKKYKDLHADMKIPRISIDCVAVYLHTYNKTLDKISIDLYHDGFVNFVRLAEVDFSYFFKAECRASMKLNVTYIVDIKFDEHGVVQACQCDCGAGMGPHAHCKHVTCVLFGLTQFCDKGEFITLQTCTQQLQTFHHTKRHNGSPVKVENLMVRVNENLVYDPRPMEFRNQAGYSAYFTNICINSCAMHQSPISQTFIYANPYAALKDHSYFALDDPMEFFLRSLRITEITESEVKAVQVETIGQSTNTQWKQERKKRLSASNFGRICKMTDRTNKQLFVKSLMVHKDIQTPAVNHGKAYESIAVKKYEEKTNNKTQECGLFVSKQYPMLCATPDRIVNENVILEVKCPFSAKDKMISPDTVTYLKQVDGKLTLCQNHDYYYQVQGQMLCTEATETCFVIYTLHDIQVIRIGRDESFIKEMTDKLICFFNQHFRQALLDKYLACDYFDEIHCKCVKFNTELPGCVNRFNHVLKTQFVVRADVDSQSANTDDTD